MYEWTNMTDLLITCKDADLWYSKWALARHAPKLYDSLDKPGEVQMVVQFDASAVKIVLECSDNTYSHENGTPLTAPYLLAREWNITPVTQCLCSIMVRDPSTQHLTTLLEHDRDGFKASVRALYQGRTKLQSNDANRLVEQVIATLCDSGSDSD